MERESSGVPVWIWVIAGAVIVCIAVSIVACVAMVVLLGVNPFAPIIYDQF